MPGELFASDVALPVLLPVHAPVSRLYVPLTYGVMVTDTPLKVGDRPCFPLDRPDELADFLAAQI